MNAQNDPQIWGRTLTRFAFAIVTAGLFLSHDTQAQDGVLNPFYPPLQERMKLVDPTLNTVVYPVQLNNWWGFMNQSGQLMLYPQFEWTDYAWNGISRAVRDGKTGFISGHGNWIIAPQFSWADRFAETYAIIRHPEQMTYGFIDRRGKPITHFQFDGALRFSEGMAAVRVGNRCGFIDVRGKVVIELNFAKVRSFSEGLAMVQVPDPKNRPGQLGPVGFINKAGQVIFAERSERVRDLGQMLDGMARVLIVTPRGEQWGYMNRAFKLSIKPRFEDARDFYNGLAAVKFNGKWGYINKTGDFVVQPQFIEAWDFKDGKTLMVKTRTGYGFINRVGEFLIEPRLANAEPFFREYARIAVDKTFGYLQINGRPIFNPLLAKNGITDIRRVETIRAEISEGAPFNRVANAPPERPFRQVPYIPEYRYEPVLPQPTSQR